MRTREEINSIANGIVNGIVADLLCEFPQVRKSIDKVIQREWAEALEEHSKRTEDILLNKFGSSD